MDNKPEKINIVLFELDFLKNNFDSFTKYKFCKRIEEENQIDISNIDPNSFDLYFIWNKIENQTFLVKSAVQRL